MKKYEPSDWRAWPRKKDKIAIIGFAETKNEVPWDDKDMEFFGINEEYNFPWFKKWDRWMQIHPKWDFTRNTNHNDPNHYWWLRNEEHQCRQCAGTGFVIPLKIKDPQMTREQARMVCPACNGSKWYVPPKSRSDKFPIYMMKAYPEIPNAVRFPLSEISDALIPSTNHQKDYFTSSASMMLGMSYLLGYKRIEFYGFEMGADTEYHYQRAGFEYLVGLVQAKGVEVIFPAASTLLTGVLYGYKSMKQGHRQSLEMRIRNLQKQLEEERSVLNQMYGQQRLLRELKDKAQINIEGELANIKEDIDTQLGLMNGIGFAMQEANNIIQMYDNYFYAGTESGEDDDIEMPEGKVKQYIAVRYKAVRDDISK